MNCPPGQDKLDLFSTPTETIIEKIKSHPDLKLSKAILQACMGFGPISAKEASFNAGLPADIPVAELDDADFRSLRDALDELRSACQSQDSPASIACDANGKILAMAAFPLHFLTGARLLEFPTASALLETADKMLGSYTPPDKDRFRKLVKNELNRARGKLEKIHAELAEAENAEDYKGSTD